MVHDDEVIAFLNDSLEIERPEIERPEIEDRILDEEVDTPSQ
jgi:hypothetical protein